MKFLDGGFAQSDRRPNRSPGGPFGLTDEDEIERALREAQERARNGAAPGIIRSQDEINGTITNDPYGYNVPDPGQANDKLVNPGETDDADLENAAKARALQMLTQGAFDEQRFEDNTRAASQGAIGQAVGNHNAGAAASGFSQSGSTVAGEAGIRSRGAIAEETAVLEGRQRLRSENLQNVLAGTAISRAERGFEAELDAEAMKRQLLLDILNGDDGESESDLEAAMAAARSERGETLGGTIGNIADDIRQFGAGAPSLYGATDIGNGRVYVSDTDETYDSEGNLIGSGRLVA